MIYHRYLLMVINCDITSISIQSIVIPCVSNDYMHYALKGQKSLA